MNPSAWIARFGESVPVGGTVLDVACGRGRHTRWFRERGCTVVAIDRDLGAVEDLHANPLVELIEHDLETGAPFPVAGRAFDAVVVTNYLWRPILDDVARAVAHGGWLLYETFAAGNERLGHPSNPDFLLRPGELLDLSRAHGLHVVAYENLEVDEPRPAVVERVAATRS